MLFQAPPYLFERAWLDQVVEGAGLHRSEPGLEIAERSEHYDRHGENVSYLGSATSPDMTGMRISSKWHRRDIATLQEMDRSRPFLRSHNRDHFCILRKVLLHRCIIFNNNTVRF